MRHFLHDRLSDRAEAMLARLPGNLHEAVELIAIALRRNGDEEDKAHERLDKAQENALISEVPNHWENEA